METKQLTPGKFAVNYGLILGIIMIVITAITYFSGIMEKGEQWPNFILYIIFPVIIIYAINRYKKHNGGLLTLIEAIKVGVAVAVISALISTVFNALLFYVIDPELTDKIMDITREKLYENPKMTEEMIDKTMETIKKFSNPLLGGAIGIGLSALFGLIYSVIGGLVMKKEA
ncbi:DUF4199 domain-containing protein [Hyunsoonleella pacifica]|uniref:DUF4199 domain-containing protein n=1 Tax=Hyunsoonleella pacifica TaxID=1080224 RepID=A0A4Q9FQB8_9FLAO|nr:DUF4199 domain-containing protein [Hyunsoonleella pacifica]TBN15416.1 DUF4199 domain-containing protein [Hyunsoonleella pacifica]GGD23890.1 hypothetical protein GCM10011368_27430 [Hyunsoonleella pacifica]